MREEYIAKRKNCKHIIAISPEGIATQCYSISQAARIGFTGRDSVKKSILEDRPTRNGWRFSEGKMR